MLDWSCVVSPFQAISHVSGGVVTTSSGCSNGVDCSDESLLEDAVTTARAADQVVIVLGLSASIETEGRDRANTTLPGMQEV